MNALITGLNGQDGSYLAEFLLERGYTVYGTVRGKNPKWPDDFNPVQENLHIYHLDLGYPSTIVHLFQNPPVDFDECYNLAAQSHVGDSFSRLEETYAVTGQGACILMDEYFRAFPRGKFYQASTSEMFGNGNVGLLDTGAKFAPASPYAIAKVMAHHHAENLRERGYFTVTGILFNHESERRHASFLTQKVCIHAAKTKIGLDLGVPKENLPRLPLGYLGAYRDWGYAPQYVEIMWKLMQDDTPGPAVIGTGFATKVEDFVRKTYEYLGMSYIDWVDTDPNLVRPLEVKFLRADSRLTNNLLGNRLINVNRLIPIMVEHQMNQQLKLLVRR